MHHNSHIRLYIIREMEETSGLVEQPQTTDCFEVLCRWVMILLVCLTCPISIPLMALCWCCQYFCPLGPEACLDQEMSGLAAIRDDSTESSGVV